MGEEKNQSTENQNLENQPQEDNQKEESIQEKEDIPQEGSAVRILRQKLEQEIKTRKQLEEELTRAKELLSVSDINSLMSKVERLELENLIAKKYPELSEEIEEIEKFRKQGENTEETILRYIGKKTVEEKTQSQTGFSLGSKKLTSTPSEPTPESITKEEAEKIFKQIYSPEE